MAFDFRQHLWPRLALATGVLLFLVALRHTDWALISSKGVQLGVAAVVAIAITGAWHVVRTFAWSWCFPTDRPLPFRRLFRVRLAAEAVSYVTIRGVAGEPLKVVLLGRDTDARTATAAVALERVAYAVGTILIVGIGSTVAWLTLPLSRGWRLIFLAFAAGSALVGLTTGLLLIRREPPAPGGPLPSTRTRTTIVAKTRGFVADVVARLLALARGDRRRIAVLAATTTASYTLMSFEAWAVFQIAGAPISVGQAIAIETFTRVASFASAVIPGNLGALEAASLAAAAAVGSPAGALLALSRRVRGLFWAALGFLIYPHTQTQARASLRADPWSGERPTDTDAYTLNPALRR